MSDATFNREAAEIFRVCADKLRQQKANPFRANAYIRAARTLESLPTDAREILRREGVEGLTELPAIGRGDAAPEAVFEAVPGVGPTLSRTIHNELHVDTLEGLEVAAYDGRLAAVPGIGTRRLAAIRAGLAALLTRGRGSPRPQNSAPTVDELLDVDREYRQRPAAGKLPKIAPKRFNPEGVAWLPVLHTDRGKWHFTALFSNTARAHELGRTDDWVVVYYYDDQHREGQNTVVTETAGPQKGRRVVRGRESE